MFYGFGSIAAGAQPLLFLSEHLGLEPGDAVEEEQPVEVVDFVLVVAHRHSDLQCPSDDVVPHQSLGPGGQLAVHEFLQPVTGQGFAEKKTLSGQAAFLQ